MTDLLEIKTKMRFRDAFRYNLYVAYRMRGNQIFSLLSLVSLGLFIYNMITGQLSIDERFAQSFPLLIPPFIFFIGIPTKVWKVTVALLQTPLLQNEATYIFTPSSITLRTVQGEADIQWEEYVRIQETRWDFRFFMDKVQAQVIPKYSLTKDQIQKIRHMIEENKH